MKNLKPLLLAISAGLAMLAMLSSCGNTHTISANIKGLGNDTVLVQHRPLNVQGDMVNDTLVAANGKFFLDIADTTDVEIFVSFPSKDPVTAAGRRAQSLLRVAYLVAKPGEKFTINGSFEEPAYLQYSVKGTMFNQEYAAVRDTYKIPALKVDSLEIQLDAESIKTESPERDSVMQGLISQRQDFLKEIAATKKAYVEANLSSDLSAYLAMQLPVVEFGEVYESLGDAAKSGLFAQRLTEREARYQAYLEVMKAKETIKPGFAAPDFTLKDLDGKDISLSSLKGKMVVLDFWGSWCGWCIKGAPEMKKYHDKYKNKVQFVGIACHDTDAKWRAAIQEHGLNWMQLFNGEGDNDITRRYAIEGYPTKIILDKDLVIAAVVVGESPEFYEKLDQLAK